MQMNKAILKNSEIVIFDKKNNFTAARVSFFFFSNPLDQKKIFFSRRPYRSTIFHSIFQNSNMLIWSICVTQNDPEFIFRYVYFLALNTLKQPELTGFGPLPGFLPEALTLGPARRLTVPPGSRLC